jgi:hypothetical protein
MKKVCVLILLTNLCVLFADGDDIIMKPEPVAAPAKSRSYGTAGTVYSLSGRAKWHYADAPKVKRDLAEYGPVSSESIIETDSNSWLIIKLSGNRGYIFIGSRTKAKVVYEPFVQRSRLIRVVLLKGVVRAYSPKVKELHSCFAVVTPNASVGTPGGDILVTYLGSEDGKSGTTNATSIQGEMPVSHMIISGKPLDKPIQRKTLNTGEAVRVTTGQMMEGPILVPNLASLQSFWQDHNVPIGPPKKMTRQAVKIKREKTRMRVGTGRVTPLLLAR